MGPRATRSANDGVDVPAALADFHREHAGGDESERARVTQGTVPELVHMLVEIGRHPRHLRLRQTVDAEGLHQLAVDP